jgi:ADP-ribose pyrophosphatase YjhB (NUDIX family)
MIACTFENGQPAVSGLRHVTVGAIVVNDHHQVLLVERAASLDFSGKWTIPGGFLDRDETTAEGTLRELHEETGYAGAIVCLFRINDSPKRPKEDRQNVEFLYIVNVISGGATLNAEVSQIVWFEKDKLPEEEAFAFDHRESILRYFAYVENPFPLPILG